MEFIRSRIETQLMSLTGLSLGQLDLENPKGDPGLFGPDSISWQVHGDFSSMLIGGISALMLQALHPLALAGVWDHSNFRQDMLGRLRRTSQFISGTTFGARKDADWLIEKVRTIHLQVVGHAPDGRPYAASDPALLTWVHVAEVSNFLAAHLRYRNPHLSGPDQDRYYSEIAVVAERLGAQDVPHSRQEISDYLENIRPQLLCDERSREVLRLLLNAPSPSQLANAFWCLDDASRDRPAAGLGQHPARSAPEPAATPDDPRRGQAQRAVVALGDAQWFGAACTPADGVWMLGDAP